MRRRLNLGILSILALSIGAGCAHVEPPRGGPEDQEPPQLLVSRPDSLAVVPNLTTPVVLLFDERISERGIEAAVMVSPRTSMVRIDHRRDELRVSLRDGWVQGVVYHITVLPEIQDLFGNRRTEPISFVFSTGPPIPDTRISGRVTDRITGRNEAGVRVEAIRLADSLVYAAPTDSAGRFEMSRVPEGEYRMRAYRDMNRDRALDPFEPRDSALVTITEADAATVSLSLLLPDTTPPQLGSVRAVNENIEVQFDDHLDPDQTFTAGQVTIRAPDGTLLPIAEVGVGALEAQVREGTPGQTPAPTQPPRVPVSPAALILPSQTLMIRLGDGTALQPGLEYRVSIRGVRNVNGLSNDAEGTFTAPPRAEESPAGEVSSGDGG
ncbi:hypothetical protein BH23GEM6_BH23GEM6_04700 [soil metagenome]